MTAATPERQPPRPGDAPRFRGRCPLRWCGGATPLPADAPLEVLAAIAVVEESAPVKNDDNDPVLAELQSVDARLRLLMDMVFALYRQQADPPAARDFEMSASHLSFCATGPLPAVAESGVIELCLDVPVPRPLRLPARVLAVEGDESSWRAELELQVASEALGNALERHVFRHHRREVAEARLAASAD